MNQKEATVLEAEVRRMGLSDEEEEGCPDTSATWRESQAADADDMHCDCEDCRPGAAGSAPKGKSDDESDEDAFRWSKFCPRRPFDRRGRGPWGYPRGMGPFGGHRHRGGPFGPMGWMMMNRSGTIGPMGGHMGRRNGGCRMGPMGGPIGGCGFGPMSGPMDRRGFGPMGGYNGGCGIMSMGPFSRCGMGPMGGCGIGPMGGPMGGCRLCGPGSPWGSSECCGGFRRFGRPFPSRYDCPSEVEENTHSSADEKREKRKKSRQERRATAPDAAAREDDPNGALDSSDDEDLDDVTTFLPPWIRRFITLRQRLAHASGPRKEKIRQKMRCIAMRKFMMAQQPPFMGPQFGGPMGPWWMTQRFGGRGRGGRMGTSPMWWASEESDCEEQDDDARSTAQNASTKERGNVTEQAAEAGEQLSSSSSDEKDANVPPHLPPWMANFIRSRQQMAKARGRCDVDKTQQKRWRRRCMTSWCGPQTFQGQPGPGYFWTMQHGPKMWKKMMKHQKRAAKKANKQTDTESEVFTRCQHCGHGGATK